MLRCFLILQWESSQNWGSKGREEGGGVEGKRKFSRPRQWRRLEGAWRGERKGGEGEKMGDIKIILGREGRGRESEMAGSTHSLLSPSFLSTSKQACFRSRK